MMDPMSRRRLGALLLALASIDSALADMQPSFVWGFNTFKGTALPECARLQIFVGPGTGYATTSQPPYVMLAYEAGGITTAQTVGTDLANLWWNVDHKAGSQLVLSMTDGVGNAGGVATDLYIVTAGTGTSCHPPNPTSGLSLTTNTTKTLNSCDVLPMQISGGQKPYVITIATIGSASVTNVTLGGSYDTYNWVNRASPNSQLLATVSDASGTYAPGTALLSTAGSTDLTCGGRQSSQIDSTGRASAVSQPGTAAVTATSRSSETASPNRNKKTSLGTIIGAAAAGLVLLVVLVAGLLFFIRKRNKRNKRSHGPRQYVDSSDPYSGFGLGKVGGAPGHAGRYTGPQPLAEEVTPFVGAGGQASPYRDYVPAPYNNAGSHPSRPYSHSTNSSRPHTYSTYSSTPSETSYGPPMHVQQSPHLPPVPPLPSTGLAAVPPSRSSGYFDPYAAHADQDAYTAYTEAEPEPRPSTYGTSVAQPIAGSSTYNNTPAVQPVAGSSSGLSGSRSDSVSGSGSASGSGQPSTSAGAFAVANPEPQEQRMLDEKRGGLPQAQKENVFQHEDINDVVELPPAYKERD